MGLQRWGFQSGLAQWGEDLMVPGGDTTAIHDDTASEISAITAKGTPVAADLIIIEDSAAANVKKKVQVGDLPGVQTLQTVTDEGAETTDGIGVGGAAVSDAPTTGNELAAGDLTVDNQGITVLTLRTGEFGVTKTSATRDCAWLMDTTADVLRGYVANSQVFRVTADSVDGAVNLARDLGTSSLRYDVVYAASVDVTGNVNMGGDLNHDGTNVGFYTATPVAQQTGVAVSAAAIHAALVNLGLITA